jgi:colicin import membrane protein
MARGTTLTLDPLLPRAPAGHRAGAAMAALVHVGLLIALTFSVDWRTRTPDVVSAELWASVPQTAAPKAVERALPPTPTPTPTPTPVPKPTPAPVAEPKPPEPAPAAQPDIALERAKEQAAKKKAAADAKAQAEAEQKRLQAEKAEDKKKADADKKKRQEEVAAKAEEDKLAKQREENLKRMMGQAEPSKGTSNSTGNAAQDAAPSASYVGKLARRIRDENLVYTGTAPDSATVEVAIRSAPGGTLLGREIVKRSGFPDWDDAVLRAIDKAGALPRDVDGRVPREITIAFRRRD